MHYSQSTNTLDSGSSSSSGTAAAAQEGRPLASRHSFRGVRRRGGRWVSEIREPKKPNRIWLGSFPLPEMAAVAYDVAALALKGSDAELNFPGSASRLPVPASTSPRDIQAAAAAAAAAASLYMLGTGNSSENNAIVSQPPPPVSNSNADFIDEDLLFDMPNLLINMAEGMLLSPPRMDGSGDDVGDDNAGDQNLWSYT
ncbi:ethylene-responsive transcription factor ERF024-like [Magnolia sinica]|uniref:ethylene-responsive transcription factor ERF024-like n=1 Tax=Magnolia sinica TaxID=86752 RepID=UPI0026595247|nr:ethylene-responsive transcription factor ERF024-like [Magnolia sinica]